MDLLPKKAGEIIGFLSAFPEIKACSLYGSLANGTADQYSDIDIRADVSGIDNGVFMKALPELLSRRFPVIWHDFAVSLVPEQYIVSIAIDEKNPFCIVDLNCVAAPHMQSIQKGDLENDARHHLIKLWVANCKHFFRKTDCARDIRKMGKRAIGSACEKMSDRQILDEVLRCLENNATPETAEYIINCRKVWMKNAVR